MNEDMRRIVLTDVVVQAETLLGHVAVTETWVNFSMI